MCQTHKIGDVIGAIDGNMLAGSMMESQDLVNKTMDLTMSLAKENELPYPSPAKEEPPQQVSGGSDKGPIIDSVLLPPVKEEKPVKQEEPSPKKDLSPTYSVSPDELKKLLDELFQIEAVSQALGKWTKDRIKEPTTAKLEGKAEYLGDILLQKLQEEIKTPILIPQPVEKSPEKVKQEEPKEQKEMKPAAVDQSTSPVQTPQKSPKRIKPFDKITLQKINLARKPTDLTEEEYQEFFGEPTFVGLASHPDFVAPVGLGIKIHEGKPMICGEIQLKPESSESPDRRTS